MKKIISFFFVIFLAGAFVCVVGLGNPNASAFEDVFKPSVNFISNVSLTGQKVMDGILFLQDIGKSSKYQVLFYTLEDITYYFILKPNYLHTNSIIEYTIYSDSSVPADFLETNFPYHVVNIHQLFFNNYKLKYIFDNVHKTIYLGGLGFRHVTFNTIEEARTYVNDWLSSEHFIE